MTNPSIRRPTRADVDTIRALTRAAYARWVPLIGREPLPMTADYAKAVETHRIDLLDGEDGVIGLVETVPGADHLLIENLVIRPDCQGRGLGDRLLRHVEDLARGGRFGEIRLYTNARFEANLAFYAKRGFAEYECRELAPGTTVVYMRRPVAVSSDDKTG